jgi:phosphoribosyl 1,2-cyclic phosphodiesterase
LRQTDPDCNRLTNETIRPAPDEFQCQIFWHWRQFEIGEVIVDTFSVPHDAYDPIGFLLRVNGGRIGFLTDLGHATRLVIERVKSANVLLLETNHDMKMLQDDTRRPWSVKQRILSRHGHLSNEAAAEAAVQIVSGELRHLYLGHLSKDCNRPELAHRVVSDRLKKIGAIQVKVESTFQDSVSPTLTLG